MKQVLLKDLKQGDFFTLKDCGEYPTEKQVWIRDEYDRGEKKFCIYKFSDTNHISTKPLHAH